MQDKNSQEYKLVTSLFESGKITEEERDRLLSALDGDGAPDAEQARGASDTEFGEDENVESKVDDSERPKTSDRSDGIFTDDVKYLLSVTYEVEGNFSASEIKNVCAGVDGVRNVRTDTASKTFTVGGKFDNTALLIALDEAGIKATPKVIDINERDKKIHVDIGDGDMHVDIDDKPVSEYIKSAFGTVSSLVGKGVKTVGHAGEKIARAAYDIVHSVIADLTGEDDEPVRKVYNENYDGPYEKLRIEVKYIKGGSVFKYEDSAANVDKLKAKCVSIMSEQAYGELYDKLEEKFVGSFKYIKGAEVLKLTVEPKE